LQDRWDSDSLPLHDKFPIREKADVPHLGGGTFAVGTLLAVFLLFAAAGALTYSASVIGLATSVDGLSARVSGLSTRALHVLGRDALQPRGPRVQTADAATAPEPLHPVVESGTPAPPEAPAPRRASILIFTARPGSIATSRPTDLCYAISGASEARIEPGIGDVDPAATLTCRRVTPARTTTYELTAAGRDGIPVSEQVVIVVR
jgi:hypothetical protein